MQLEKELGFRFQRDGFVVIRDVFTPAEVAALREAVGREVGVSRELGHVFRSQGGECVPVGDILGREGLGHLVFDARLLAVARALVGRTDIAYFGDSSMMLGGRARGFHKDNTSRDDATHSDWQSAYTLVRLGIYLEHHDRFSGGLKLRRGSHLHVDITSGDIVDVPTRAGDIVAWSLRTTHSGHVVRLRGMPFLHLQPRFEDRTPQLLRAPEAGERRAIFMTYGCEDAHLEAYLEKHTNLERFADNYLYLSWQYSAVGPEYEEQARRAAVSFLKPTPDYGSRFRSAASVAGGVVLQGSAKADGYGPPRGVEALLRTVGGAVRRLKRDSSVSPR